MINNNGTVQGGFGPGNMNYQQPTVVGQANTFPTQNGVYTGAGNNAMTHFQSIASQYPSQPTQPMQKPATRLYCKMVNSPNEITVNEIPMDGITLFMTQDFQNIYAKAWNANGMIDTVVYNLPEPKEPPTSPTDDFKQIVLDRLDKIESMLSNKFNNYKHKNNQNQNAGQTPNNDVGGDQK